MPGNNPVTAKARRAWWGIIRRDEIGRMEERFGKSAFHRRWNVGGMMFKQGKGLRIPPKKRVAEWWSEKRPGVYLGGAGISACLNIGAGFSACPTNTAARPLA
jgi:hypothetical protein